MKSKGKKILAAILAGIMAVSVIPLSTNTAHAAELQEGEMALTKVAEPVPGKANTWRVTVTAEGKDKAKPKDYILIVDKSASMMKNKDGVKQTTENESTRIYLAKDAAKDLAAGIYEKDERNRVAVMSFSSAPTSDIDVKTGDYKTGEHTKLDIDFTGADGKDDVNAAIDDIEATGGTYTQLALHEAQAMAEAAHDADPREDRERIIILLTDGLPTISVPIDWTKVSEDAFVHETVTEFTGQGQRLSSKGEKYYIDPSTGKATLESNVPAGQTWEPYMYSYAGFGTPIENALSTTEKIPGEAFNYDDMYTKTFGIGVDTRWVRVDGEMYNDEQIYVNTLASTIAETNLIREKGDAKDLYVIGYDVNASEADSIKKLAGDDKHYVDAKGTGVADAMQMILERTSVPSYDAAVADAIPLGFTQPDELEASCGTVSFENGVLT